MVELLLTAGANVNHVRNDGWIPLFIALVEHDSGTAGVLLDAGANINHVSNNGWTFLCYAAYSGDITIGQFLLDHGADIHYALPVDDSEDLNIKQGDTPLVIARKRGHAAVAQLIEEQLQREISAVPIEPDLSPCKIKQKKREKCVIQ